MMFLLEGRGKDVLLEKRIGVQIKDLGKLVVLMWLELSNEVI